MHNKPPIPDFFTAQFIDVVDHLVDNDHVKELQWLANILFQGIASPKVILAQIRGKQKNVTKSRRDSVVKKLEERFNINPQYFLTKDASVYKNNMVPITALEENNEEYTRFVSDKNIMNIQDVNMIKRLRSDNEKLTKELELANRIIVEKERYIQVITEKLETLKDHVASLEKTLLGNPTKATPQA